MLPSADTMTRRGKLHGLGKDLFKMDLKNQNKGFKDRTFYRRTLQFHASFIEAADSGLPANLRYSQDYALLEAHGEQMLDLYIRLASELDWERWMWISLEVVASAGNPQVFHRLLDASPSVLEFCSVDIPATAIIVCKFEDHPTQCQCRYRLQRLLCCAANGGSMDIFSSLVGIDGFLKLAQRNSVDLLAAAAAGGNVDIFSFLVGIDGFLRSARTPGYGEDWRRYQDRRLLAAAAAGGNVAILSALFDIDDGLLALVRNDLTRDTYGGRSHMPALHSAAQHGHARFAAALIAAGAPVEHRHYSDTALNVAVREGHEEVVRELLSAVADINTENSYVYSLLNIAVCTNNERMMDVLLAAGEDMGEDGTDKLNLPRQPLHAAAMKGFCRPLEKLLRVGANVNWVDSKGRTALHLACSHNHEDAVEVLLRHNASVTSLCDGGLSPQDVVAVGALQRQQIRMRRRPFTLDAAHTVVAGRVCAMLRGASAWGRRGWLVILRARRQGAAKVVDASSLTLSSSSAEALNEDQAARVGVELADGDIDAFSAPAIGRSNSITAAASDATLEHTVAPGGTSHDMRESLTTGTTVDGGDEDGGQAGRSGWPGAVEWLVGRLDEHGVFREILSFL